MHHYIRLLQQLLQRIRMLHYDSKSSYTPFPHPLYLSYSIKIGAIISSENSRLQAKTLRELA